ncbi:platelet adherence protein A-like [Leptopilina heterotoma]|uniref:platelet adherence protein A-like n=1 Tax=Leptopilina heterotoma TaxID=63436 RepID=UPI001CA8F653|nr:platelet adherence protein A-like [Leptopilina heterotoma]
MSCNGKDSCHSCCCCYSCCSIIHEKIFEDYLRKKIENELRNEVLKVNNTVSIEGEHSEASTTSVSNTTGQYELEKTKKNLNADEAAKPKKDDKMNVDISQEVEKKKEISTTTTVSNEETTKLNITSSSAINPETPTISPEVEPSVSLQVKDERLSTTAVTNTVSEYKKENTNINVNTSGVAKPKEDDDKEIFASPELSNCTGNEPVTYTTTTNKASGDTIDEDKLSLSIQEEREVSSTVELTNSQSKYEHKKTDINVNAAGVAKPKEDEKLNVNFSQEVEKREEISTTTTVTNEETTKLNITSGSAINPETPTISPEAKNKEVEPSVSLQVKDERLSTTAVTNTVSEYKQENTNINVNTSGVAKPKEDDDKEIFASPELSNCTGNEPVTYTTTTNKASGDTIDEDKLSLSIQEEREVSSTVELTNSQSKYEHKKTDINVNAAGVAKPKEDEKLNVNFSQEVEKREEISTTTTVTNEETTKLNITSSSAINPETPTISPEVEPSVSLQVKDERLSTTAVTNTVSEYKKENTNINVNTSGVAKPKEDDDKEIFASPELSNCTGNEPVTYTTTTNKASGDTIDEDKLSLSTQEKREVSSTVELTNSQSKYEHKKTDINVNAAGVAKPKEDEKLNVNFSQEVEKREEISTTTTVTNEETTKLNITSSSAINPETPTISPEVEPSVSLQVKDERLSTTAVTNTVSEYKKENTNINVNTSGVAKPKEDDDKEIFASPELSNCTGNEPVTYTTTTNKASGDTIDEDKLSLSIQEEREVSSTVELTNSQSKYEHKKTDINVNAAGVAKPKEDEKLNVNFSQEVEKREEISTTTTVTNEETTKLNITSSSAINPETPTISPEVEPSVSLQVKDERLSTTAVTNTVSEYKQENTNINVNTSGVAKPKEDDDKEIFASPELSNCTGNEPVTYTTTTNKASGDTIDEDKLSLSIQEEREVSSTVELANSQSKYEHKKTDINVNAAGVAKPKEDEKLNVNFSQEVEKREEISTTTTVTNEETTKLNITSSSAINPETPTISPEVEPSVSLQVKDERLSTTAVTNTVSEYKKENTNINVNTSGVAKPKEDDDKEIFASPELSNCTGNEPVTYTTTTNKASGDTIDEDKLSLSIQEEREVSSTVELTNSQSKYEHKKTDINVNAAGVAKPKEDEKLNVNFSQEVEKREEISTTTTVTNEETTKLNITSSSAINPETPTISPEAKNKEVEPSVSLQVKDERLSTTAVTNTVSEYKQENTNINVNTSGVAKPKEDDDKEIFASPELSNCTGNEPVTYTTTTNKASGDTIDEDKLSLSTQEKREVSSTVELTNSQSKYEHKKTDINVNAAGVAKPKEDEKLNVNFSQEVEKREEISTTTTVTNEETTKLNITSSSAINPETPTISPEVEPSVSLQVKDERLSTTAVTNTVSEYKKENTNINVNTSGVAKPKEDDDKEIFASPELSNCTGNEPVTYTTTTNKASGDTIDEDKLSLSIQEEREVSSTVELTNSQSKYEHKKTDINVNAAGVAKPKEDEKVNVNFSQEVDKREEISTTTTVTNEETTKLNITSGSAINPETPTISPEAKNKDVEPSASLQAKDEKISSTTVTNNKSTYERENTNININSSGVSKPKEDEKSNVDFSKEVMKKEVTTATTSVSDVEISKLNITSESPSTPATPREVPEPKKKEEEPTVTLDTVNEKISSTTVTNNKSTYERENTNINASSSGVAKPKEDEKINVDFSKEIEKRVDSRTTAIVSNVDKSSLTISANEVVKPNKDDKMNVEIIKEIEKREEINSTTAVTNAEEIKLKKSLETVRIPKTPCKMFSNCKSGVENNFQIKDNVSVKHTGGVTKNTDDSILVNEAVDKEVRMPDQAGLLSKVLGFFAQPGNDDKKDVKETKSDKVAKSIMAIEAVMKKTIKQITIEFIDDCKRGTIQEKISNAGIVLSAVSGDKKNENNSDVNKESSTNAKEQPTSDKLCNTEPMKKQNKIAEKHVSKKNKGTKGRKYH